MSETTSPFDLIHKPKQVKVWKLVNGEFCKAEKPVWLDYGYRDEEYVSATALRFVEAHPERKDDLITIEELKAFDEQSRQIKSERV